jgi:hypothetical protein
MMQGTTTKSRPPAAGGIITAIGGILVLVSSFPIWGRVSTTAGNQHRDVKASSAVLIAGIVILVIGVLMVAIRSRGARIALAVIAILGGVLALVASIGYVGSKDTILNTVADKVGDESGIDHATAEKQFKQGLDAGQIKVETGLGAYLALAGGVLALVGGIVGLRKGRSAAPATDSYGYGSGTASGFPTGVAAQPAVPPAAPPPTGPPPSAPPGGPPPSAPPAGPPASAPPAGPPASAPPAGPPASAPPAGPPPAGPPAGPPPGAPPPEPPADGGGSFTG